LRLCETKKLHYGEYIYKIEIYNGLAGHFRTERQRAGKLSWTKQVLDELNATIRSTDEQVIVSRGRFNYPISTTNFYDAINLYRILLKHDCYKIRVEVNTLFIYTNDRDFCTKIINQCAVANFWEPNPNKLAALQSDKNIILVDKEPEYQYKVTLGPKKGQPSLAKWVDANPKLAKMGDVAKEECLHNGWVKGYYFYVKNSQTLLIAELMVGDNIARLEKLVYVAE
jgi:hypothetical protein